MSLACPRHDILTNILMCVISVNIVSFDLLFTVFHCIYQFLLILLLLSI